MKKQTELIQFEKQYLEKFNAIIDLNKQIKDLEVLQTKVKNELEAAMIKHDVKSVKIPGLTITRVKESSKTEIHWENLKKTDPKLYEELLNDFPKITKSIDVERLYQEEPSTVQDLLKIYPKVTTKAGYVRFSIG